MRRARVLRILVIREVTIILHYRWWLAFLQLSNIIAPAISLLVWRGAIAHGATPPVTETFLTTYLVLVSIVSMLTSSWTSFFLAESIRLGGLSSWLIRPCSTHLNGIANNLGEKIVKLCLLVPLVSVLGIIFRSEVDLPTAPMKWLIFSISLLAAGAMTYSLDIVIGSLAFWFEDVSAINRLRYLLSGILSGAVIPLALLPAGLREYLDAQPFRFMVSFPLEVLLGHPSRSGFALQFGWFVTFVGAAVIVWRVGLRNYQGAGA
jgi:ABC-2 type transport system permease protein